MDLPPCGIRVMTLTFFHTSCANGTRMHRYFQKKREAVPPVLINVPPWGHYGQFVCPLIK